MQNTVITIARGYGSGGKTIGKMLAEDLGIHFYDRELLRLASDDSGIHERLFGQADEKIKKSLFMPGTHVYKGELFPPESDEFVSNDNLFNYQAKIIKELASTHSCVIVGRCADYVLRRQEGVLNVFIHAPLDERIFRTKETYQVDAPDIRSYVLKQDKNRAAYYEHFTDSVWGKAENYHLAINSTIGLDTTVELILALAKERGLQA